MDSDLHDLLGLGSQEVSWDQVYLDPQNPRLTGIEHGHEPAKVPDDEIPGVALQAQLLARLKAEQAVDELAEKIKKLGFLTIDRIVVRPLSGQSDEFVVLEGNRRIAAIRSIQASAAVLASLEDSVRDSLNKFEVLVYDGGDDDIAWELQGLRHMGGVRSWGPYQQARFLVDLKERRALQVNEVAQIAGLGRTTASRMLRSYYGFIQATQDADFGDQIGEQDFSVFQEAIFHKNNSALWAWLDWDESTKTFLNSDNLRTLLWLLKDRDTGSGEPRIGRVNPDLRDKFAKLLSDGHQELLQQFLNDELSIDQALQKALAAEDAGAGEMADLHFWRTQLSGMKERLGNLPVPAVIESHRADEFKELLEALESTISLQVRFLELESADE